MLNVHKLVVCEYGDIAKNITVFNKNQFEYWTWIQLPSQVLRDFELYEINEYFPNKGEADWIGKVTRECGRPWLKAQKELFNLEIGKHVYQLKFVNKYTDDIVTYYSAYIIQDSEPSKPYIYMDRSSDEDLSTETD